MSAGFVNGIIQTNLTGLVYANGTNAHANEVSYSTNVFTPAIFGSTTAGTTTYTNQTGTYTKIGNRVMFSVNISFTLTTGTGDLSVGNLPFSSVAYPSIHTVITSNIPWPNNQETYIVGNLAASSSTIVLTGYHNTTTPINVQMPTGAGTYNLILSGTYQSVS